MGWISWLCPGIQLKRWLLLFTAGVIVCAFSLALLFNNQVMGMAEELLFRLSYLATGEYGNTVPLVLGIVGMLVGIGIMIYAVRHIVRSIVEAVSPESSDSLLETIFTERKLSSGEQRSGYYRGWRWDGPFHPAARYEIYHGQLYCRSFCR